MTSGSIPAPRSTARCKAGELKPRTTRTPDPTLREPEPRGLAIATGAYDQSHAFRPRWYRLLGEDYARARPRQHPRRGACRGLGPRPGRCGGVCGRVRQPTTAHTDYGEFLANVDAVAFSVPPDVQAHRSRSRPRAWASTCLLGEADRVVGRRRGQAGRRGRGGTGRVGRVLHLAVQHRDPRLAHRRACPRRLGRRGAGQAGPRSWLGTSLAARQPVPTPRGGGKKGALWDLGPRTSSACCGPASAQSPR